MVDESYKPEWGLFALEKDPHELSNVYVEVVTELTQLYGLHDEVGDTLYTPSEGIALNFCCKNIKCGTIFTSHWYEPENTAHLIFPPLRLSGYVRDKTLTVNWTRH